MCHEMNSNMDPRSNSIDVMPSTGVRSERGIAMVLVMVVLAAATIVAGAVLTQRDTTATMAQNLEDASEAKWAADGSANFAIAVLEQGVADGTDLASLVSNLAMGSAVADVKVYNIDGEIADADDTEVIVVAVSGSNGQKAYAQKQVSLVKADPPAEIDPSFPEFAIIAMEKLVIGERAGLTNWWFGPGAGTLSPARVAVAFTDVGSMSIHSGARSKNVELWRYETADLAMRNAKWNFFTNAVTMEGWIPVHKPITPSALDSMAAGSDIELLAGETVRVPPGTALGDVTLASVGTILGLNGSGDYRFGELRIGSGAKLVIKGDVRLVVTRDSYLSEGSSIEFYDDDSTLELWVQDDIIFDGSVFLGPKVASYDRRTYKDVGDYVDPSRFRIIMDARAVNPIIELEQYSIVPCAIYAPTARVRMEYDSVIIGRIVCRELELEHNAVVLYDAAMDSRSGLTAGALVEKDGSSTTVMDDMLASLDADSTEEEIKLAYASAVGGGDAGENRYRAATKRTMPRFAQMDKAARPQENASIGTKESWSILELLRALLGGG